MTDSVEQAQRFAQQNQQRQRMGKPQMQIDRRFLAALEHGLPDCSGVALGVDRLLMLLAGAETLSDTLSFDSQRA